MKEGELLLLGLLAALMLFGPVIWRVVHRRWQDPWRSNSPGQQILRERAEQRGAMAFEDHDSDEFPRLLRYPEGDSPVGQDDPRAS